MSGFQSAAVTMSFASLRRFFAQLLLALIRTGRHVQKNLMCPRRRSDRTRCVLLQCMSLHLLRFL
jgi:hypothetical protein